MEKITRINSKMIILLLIMSPGFWFPILKLNSAIGEFKNAPSYFQNKTNLFTKERLEVVDTMRWANRDFSAEDKLYSKLFYNKATIIVDEFASYMSLFSPRYYFQSGDGSGFSPTNVEPILLVLFPFWLMGIYYLVKSKKMRPIYLYLFSALLIFMFGKRELPFTWIMIVFNLYFCGIALRQVKLAHKNVLIAGILLYALFINARLMIL